MVGSIFAFSHKVGLQVVCYKIQVPWLGEKISSPPKVTATSEMIYLGPKFFINL